MVMIWLNVFIALNVKFYVTFDVVYLLLSEIKWSEMTGTAEPSWR